MRQAWGEATVLTVTFLLTIFRDLTEAIVAGFALGSQLLFSLDRLGHSTMSS